MTERTFALWVEPIAAQLRLGRGQIVLAARQMFPEQWPLPSPLRGWTNKDLLAHLATGDWVCQTVLHAVTANEPLDLAAIGLDAVNAGNARLLQERRERSVEELITEVEAESAETQELLGHLTEEDEGRTQEGAPISLGDYLRGFPEHDRQHLAELRTALESVML
jgi:hypothetical protein